MIAAHNDAGHRGFYPTNALAAERYWWPFISKKVKTIYGYIWLYLV